ncbi:MAG: hypothetical protein M1820_009832 [Bogoriella megaspora]|nr:MAG: hypothetical protein M1820_009832 [Bogoriella megaspora]
MSGPPPPPPPPHGENPRTTSGLPPGNYDIFIIPPHASGGGFLYLPSLQPHRNSFLAGCACTILGMSIWTAIAPALKKWVEGLSQMGGSGMAIIVVGVGVLAWAIGKTQAEGGKSGDSRSAGAGGAGTQGNQGNAGSTAGAGAAPPPQPPPNASGFPGSEGYTPGASGFNAGPKPAGSNWGQQQRGQSTGGTAWEKAREETQRREKERKAAEEARKAAEEAKKRREEAEKKAREAAEKEKWEKARAREKEAREREAREKVLRERIAKEKEAREADAREREAREKEAREKEAKEREAKEKEAKEKEAKEKEAREKARRTAASSAPTASQGSPKKSYQRPTAKSAIGTDEDAFSFRPYDTPKRPVKTASSSSIYSESSYAPSQTTARTTPPPSYRGPYATKDPDKIVIKAVYLFNNLFPKPVAQLVSGTGSVTDGLILKITTEGLFIDDDVRGVGQREWDVKAWGMKLIETVSISDPPLHVLRASVRDAEGKKYVFILKEEESWKVAVGLQRLRRGPLVRSLGSSGLPMSEAKSILGGLGYM